MGPPNSWLMTPPYLADAPPHSWLMTPPYLADAPPPPWLDDVLSQVGYSSVCVKAGLHETCAAGTSFHIIYVAPVSITIDTLQFYKTSSSFFSRFSFGFSCCNQHYVSFVAIRHVRHRSCWSKTRLINLSRTGINYTRR